MKPFTYYKWLWKRTMDVTHLEGREGRGLQNSTKFRIFNLCPDYQDNVENEMKKQCRCMYTLNFLLNFAPFTKYYILLTIPITNHVSIPPFSWLVSIGPPESPLQVWKKKFFFRKPKWTSTYFIDFLGYTRVYRKNRWRNI